MKFRYYVTDNKSLKQPYQYFEIGLFWAFISLIIALNISDLVPFLRLSKFVKNELTGVTFLTTIACLIGYLVANQFRERIPVIKVEKMSIKELEDFLAKALDRVNA